MIRTLASVALLVAAMLRHGASKPGPWRTVVVAHFALLAVVFAAAFLLAPRSIDTVEWLRGRSDLPRIAHVFFAVLAIAAAAAAFGARRASLPSAALLATALLALMPAIHAGMSTLTPINSWKPVADLLRSAPDFEDAHNTVLRKSGRLHGGEQAVQRTQRLLDDRHIGKPGGSSPLGDQYPGVAQMS